MPSENVEIVRRAYAAFNAQRADALVELLSARFRWEPNPDEPERRPREGIEEARAFLDGQWRALPGLHSEVLEILAAGNEVVAVVLHTAVVPGSETPIQRGEAHAWTLEDGEIVRLREFRDREAAVQAAGLG